MMARIVSIALVLAVIGWIGLNTVNASASLPAPALPPAPATQPVGPIADEWARSPHAHTYDQGKGPNSYCSRCHSPLNWDPGSKVDPQPDCVSCKFPFDKAMRVAKGNPPVAEKDWKNIGCEICHRVENGSVTPGIAWWNASSSRYEEVANSTALCSRCHADTETLRHARDLGTSAHNGFTCTSCHSPHSTAATCTESGCHDGTHGGPAPGTGHDSAHRSVTCGACHDASGLTVGPDSKTGKWVTIRTTVVMDRSSTGPYQSHNLQRKVDCARCHYQGNPWGLAVHRTEEGHGASTIQPRQGGQPVPPKEPDSLSISIASPAEGETYYAGPGVILYTAQLEGSFSAESLDPAATEVQLEIVSGGQTGERHTTRPLPDGSFYFDLTVNPDASWEKFPPERQSCETCHKSGETSLPPGQSTLKVTATAPDGRKATIERHITVDRAGYATVPVQVVMDDDRAKGVPGVPVSGSTWLHLWRTRVASAATDANGLAQVRVEALAMAPTHYRFEVSPTVIDRVLYESTGAVQVDLPAGAKTAPPITLRIQKRLGEIRGTIQATNGAPLQPVDVKAILLPEGRVYRVKSTPEGTFEFTNLPLAEYVVTPDQEMLAARGLASTEETVRLSSPGSSSVQISVAPATGKILRSTVRGVNGDVLPFAWASIEAGGFSRATNPVDGTFTVPGSSGGQSVVVSAPGYFSQATRIQPGETGSGTDWSLVQRPDTRSVPWGSGEVVIPSDSDASVRGRQIDLKRGWVWGHGDGEVVTVATETASIRMAGGAFGVEKLPGRSPWLFVRDGRAVVYPGGNEAPKEVRAGEVMALTGDAFQTAVPADPSFLAISRADSGSLLPVVWEQDPDARARDKVTQAGIGAVQGLTLITYSLTILLLIPVPLLGAIWWSRRRASSLPRNSRGEKQ